MLTLLSEFSADALRDDGEVISGPTANAVIARALGNLNMITAGGKICRKSFAPEFARRFGFLRPRADFSKSVSAASIEILCRSLDKPNIWRQSIQNVLLLSWLFGTWNVFKEQCLSCANRA
ncbi:MULTISPECIES: hypothetical protein [Duganella]|uniref:hypothetical protein n=1 Tax=Duganella TaxID=75654 RepID=UPI00159CF892